MKPYYQDSFVTLYHGDCREIVPTLGRFDLLLTDPPYGIGEAAGKNKSRSKLARAKDYGDLQWDNATIAAGSIREIMSYCGDSILWGGNYYADGLPASSCWFVWDKDNGDNDFADCEMAWTSFSAAARLFKWRWAGMLQENMAEKEYRVHPTQKPVALMKWCINRFDITNQFCVQTILDPFAGSGTTGRAAKDLGRKCTLIEKEEKYCEIAARRMQQEVLEFAPEVKA